MMGPRDNYVIEIQDIPVSNKIGQPSSDVNPILGFIDVSADKDMHHTNTGLLDQTVLEGGLNTKEQAITNPEVDKILENEIFHDADKVVGFVNSVFESDLDHTGYEDSLHPESPRAIASNLNIRGIEIVPDCQTASSVSASDEVFTSVPMPAAVRKDLEILSLFWKNGADELDEDSLSPIVGNISPTDAANQDNASTENDSFTEVLSKSQKKKLRKSKRIAQKSGNCKAYLKAG